MKTLIKSLKWDTVLIYRYGIIAVAGTICLLYSVAFFFINTNGMEKVVAAFIFSDPVMYGFLFTAIMVLFEKDARTSQALTVTPLTTQQYLISKAIVFTLLGLLFSLAVILASNPEQLHIVLFTLAVVLSSVLFVFVGVIGVSYVKNFNQFILTIPIVLAPVCLPFLDYFNVLHSWLFYFIPTQASLLLFSGSVGEISMWQGIYAIAYLLLCIYLTYIWAVRSYNKRIIKSDKK